MYFEPKSQVRGALICLTSKPWEPHMAVSINLGSFWWVSVYSALQPPGIKSSGGFSKNQIRKQNKKSPAGLRCRRTALILRVSTSAPGCWKPPCSREASCALLCGCSQLLSLRGLDGRERLFPEIVWGLIWGPQNKTPYLSGSVLGAPDLGKFPNIIPAGSE